MPKLCSRRKPPSKIPREAPAGEVPRQGAGQGFSLSHECLRTSRPQGGRSLQEQMAGGTILQVAQATPQDQEVLGNDRERRADPGRRVDCRFLPRGDCAQETWNHAIRLRDAPDTQRLPDRQDLRAGTL